MGVGNVVRVWVPARSERFAVSRERPHSTGVESISHTSSCHAVQRVAKFGRERVQIGVHATVLEDQGLFDALILDALARYVVDRGAERDPLELTI